MKEREKCKKTSHHRPQCANGSQGIPFQSQEFEQYGCRHFVDFQPRFHLIMTSQTQCCKTLKKMKVRYLMSYCLICLKFCRLLEVNKRISLDFKFRGYGNSKENNQPLFKSKIRFFSNNKKSASPIFLRNLILPAVAIKLYCFKLLFKHPFCLNNRPFVFPIIDHNFDYGCHSNKIWNEAKFRCQVLTACKVSNKSNRRLLSYCTFIFLLSWSIASMTSYLIENEAENLQNGDVHLVQIPDFEMEYLENHLVHWGR